MAIGSFDGFIGSTKQYISFSKTTVRATTTVTWASVFDVAGNPGGGTIAGTSTASGVVPTDATIGCPDIVAFTGSTGYLAQVSYGNSVASRIKLFDLLFKAGAYAYTAGTTTLSSQPSYSSRIPGGNYADTQIWFEVSTIFATGTSWQVQVTYTNQAGVSGRSTVISVGAAAAALYLGRLWQLPLQAGDSGVQKIESVIVTNGGTAMTAGAFNVLVLRPLWAGRCRINNDGDVHDLVRTGMPIVFADSAFYLAVSPDSTATGLIDLELVLANG